MHLKIALQQDVPCSLAKFRMQVQRQQQITCGLFQSQRHNSQRVMAVYHQVTNCHLVHLQHGHLHGGWGGERGGGGLGGARRGRDDVWWDFERWEGLDEVCAEGWLEENCLAEEVLVVFLYFLENAFLGDYLLWLLLNFAHSLIYNHICIFFLCCWISLEIPLSNSTVIEFEPFILISDDRIIMSRFRATNVNNKSNKFVESSFFSLVCFVNAVESTLILFTTVFAQICLQINKLLITDNMSQLHLA